MSRQLLGFLLVLCLVPVAAKFRRIPPERDSPSSSPAPPLASDFLVDGYGIFVAEEDVRKSLFQNGFKLSPSTQYWSRSATHLTVAGTPRIIISVSGTTLTYKGQAFIAKGDSIRGLVQKLSDIGLEVERVGKLIAATRSSGSRPFQLVITNSSERVDHIELDLEGL
jgi:hypothetical protein